MIWKKEKVELLQHSLALQQIIYLYFHCFLLIPTIILSMMTAGLISVIIFWVCFYYLIKRDSIYLGHEYSYPKVIKATLMIIVLDIIIQGIYQYLFLYRG